MRIRHILAVLFLVVAAVEPAASASCSAYASSLVFGNYFGSTIDVTGSITVTCTSGTVFNIGLNAGNTPGATITTRQMFGGQGGQNKFGYQLFNDAARTINWGNSSGTNWVTGTGTGNAQTFTIYARIPSSQSVPQGSYTDTITASITGNFSTATAQFSVTSTVVPSCSINATDLNFGNYDGGRTASTSLITVTCSNGLAYNVGLNAGTAPGATVTNRNMIGPGGALLSYILTQNASHTKNWGNTIGVDTESGTGTGSAQRMLVYGQVTRRQEVPPGIYTDTITATVTF